MEIYITMNPDNCSAGNCQGFFRRLYLEAHVAGFKEMPLLRINNLPFIKIFHII